MMKCCNIVDRDILVGRATVSFPLDRPDIPRVTYNHIRHIETLVLFLFEHYIISGPNKTTLQREMLYIYIYLVDKKETTIKAYRGNKIIANVVPSSLFFLCIATTAMVHPAYDVSIW